MAPIFTVMILENRKLMNLHTSATLEKYYPILADGANTTIDKFTKKYQNSNSRLFYYEDDWRMYTLDDLDVIPHFLLSLDQTEILAEEDWNLILVWVKSIFNGEDDYELNEQIYNLIPAAPTLEPLPPVKEEEDEQPHEYSFRFVEDDSRDIALFEVTKPFTDRPYTTIIRQYSKKGKEPMFTSFFICPSWGVCNHDIVFLKKLWKHLDMPGELDVNEKLKEHVARCQPDYPGGPEAEPEVYRSSIEALSKQFFSKRDSDDFIEVTSKKIKTN